MCRGRRPNPPGCDPRSPCLFASENLPFRERASLPARLSEVDRYAVSEGHPEIPAPGYGSPVEWHQDWAFYPHTNDDLAAVGIMIDDVDMENGPMMIVPGSHKGPIWDHHVNGHFVGGIDPTRANIDFKTAQPCIGK